MSTEPQQERLIAGRYRLRTQLGQGAMGTVWSGYDEVLHRSVAIKEVRLPADFPAERTAEVRERALREARAIAVLSHPNVITVHDVAREGDEPFVVMELLPSHSLAGLLRTHGSLTVTQTAAIADAVAAALEAAHHAGITHRDVKPGNVLIAESATSYSEGRIKLTDFGIARNMSEISMTRTGIMLGSPAYIAPEVASGDPAMPAADLWSLGATMFAAVEGRVPYDADGDPLQTVLKVVHDEVPTPRPGPLAPLIEGLMVKQPGDRMSLLEVRRQLHGLIPEPGTDLFSDAMFTEVLPKAPGVPDLATTQVISSARPTDPDRPEAAVAEPSTAARSEPGAADGPGTRTRHDEGDPEAGMELAADPGPLPFTPRPRRPRRRGALSSLVLGLTAVVLFTAAGAGGFAAARTLGEAPLLPPTAGANGSDTPPPIGELTVRRGAAATVKGAQGGAFTVRVPENWRRFRSLQPSSTLPASTVVQYVSQDGRHTLTVERFVDFYPGHTIDDYLNELPEIWPGRDFRLRNDSITNARPAESERPREFSYRTVDRAAADSEGGTEQADTQWRSTFAQAFPSGSDMWVLSVTVPAEQENLGRRDLYQRIAPSLRVTG